MKQFYLFLIVILFTNSIYAQHTAIPDDNFEQALIDLMLDDILDNQVLTTNINSINSLNLISKGITDFTGLEAFVALTHLDVRGNLQTTLDVSMLPDLQQIRAYSNNNLTSINVTGLTMLNYLRVNNTGLTSLDISTNVNLEHLWAFTLNNLDSPIDVSNNLLLREVLIHNSNYIGPLDLSQHLELTYLSLSNNDISSLDLNNGLNNAITFFEAVNMTTLSCISVDNAMDANAGLNNYANWTKDAAISYSNDCGTYVPDDNFEQALIDLNLDSGDLDNYVPTNNISGITTLSVSNKGIINLTGLNDFVSLETLVINDNMITNIDLSALVNLKTLRTTRNAIVNLDLSNQILLEVLIADNNGTENLTLNSTNISYLQIAQNNLTTIDLSDFSMLERLYCGGNNLANLDVTNNFELKTIECNNNNLESLNISANSNMIDLLANDNQLISLNVKNGNNTILTNFRADNNSSLACIEVDDEVQATNSVGSYASWVKDNSAIYSVDCATLSTDNFESKSISIYPNPVVDILNIKMQNNILVKIDVVDINGRLMLTKENNLEQVNISQLVSGIYYITLYASNRIKTIKIVKK